MTARYLLVEDRALRVAWFKDRFGAENLVHTLDVDEAIELLSLGQFEFLFLDHDLGTEPKAGRDVALWLIAHPEVLPNLKIITHTHNSVSGQKIERELQEAGRPARWKPFATWEPDSLGDISAVLEGRWQRIDVSEMLRAWAVAEIRSRRGPQMVAAGALPQRLLEVCLVQEFDALSPADWEAIENVIVDSRGALLSGLLLLNVQWYTGDLTIAEARHLRCFNLRAYLEKAPSGMLMDLAGRRYLEGVEPEFRGLETDLEMPIAVGPSLAGPFCLVEGYSRTASWLRDHAAGIPSKDALPFIIGTSSRIHHWAHPRGHKWWPAGG